MKHRERLQHGRVFVQLYELSSGPADLPDSSEPTPLLLLHELGSSAAQWCDEAVGFERGEAWNGPVYAIDFAGHGESDRVSGSGYYPELFLAEADLALAAIGDRAYLAGAGLGAYVAMLLAGSRHDRVPAALLLPGRGLACAGVEPDLTSTRKSIDSWAANIETSALEYSQSADPFVATCEHDLRPLDYVGEFASTARRLLFSAAVDTEPTSNVSIGWWRHAVRSSDSKGEQAPAELAAALRQLAG